MPALIDKAVFQPKSAETLAMQQALAPRLSAAFRFGWALEELVYRGHVKTHPPASAAAVAATAQLDPEFPPDLAHTRSEETLLGNLVQELISLEPSLLNAPNAQPPLATFVPADFSNQVSAVTADNFGALSTSLIKWDLDIINQLLKSRELDPNDANHYYDVLTAYEVGKALSITLWRISLDPSNKSLWQNELFSDDRITKLQRHLQTLS